MKYIVGLTLLALLMSGCGIKAPSTSEDYRTIIKESAFGKHETFMVEQSFKKVSQAMERNTDKCLKKSFNVYTHGTLSSHISNEIHYNPSLIQEQKSLELQMHVYDKEMCNSMFTKHTCLPEKGYWAFVVDFKPVGKTTQMDIYGPAMVSYYDLVYKALKLWAEGKSNGCPDMNKVGAY